ncbi:MAG TPA: alpha/beta family hydrolase [Candidatus Limnocylindrales bacterium]|nr:alpha/beta family hydrolase [Candidatus Limnocylindrales bacterium]
MAIRFYVGHGASGSAASMAAHAAGLVARGVDARAIDLPLRKAEAAVPVFRTIVPDRPERDGVSIAVGGQSYGGRVASLAAAEPETEYTALVLFSFPLHLPGKPAMATERTAHWPAIRCPVLLLSGEADPMARLELLQAAVPLLHDGELVTYPRLGHTLKPVLQDALDRAAAFLLRFGSTTSSST